LSRDAFGRVISSYSPTSGNEARGYHALSVDVSDGEQTVLNGEHSGALTSVATDGHGRRTLLTRHVRARPPGSVIGPGPHFDTRNTKTEYLPTGEATKITESHHD